jgi:hypothetical protein
MSRIPKRVEREFIRRCKALAERNGERLGEHPARFLLKRWDLKILWQPDEMYLDVRIILRDRKPEDVVWCLVVKEIRKQPEWGYVLEVFHYLDLMERAMILEDLADV